MTNDKIALQALLEKTSDASMLRDMISFAGERLMALETEPLCGAAPGERSAERINQRNGYDLPPSSRTPLIRSLRAGKVFDGKDETRVHTRVQT